MILFSRFLIEKSLRISFNFLQWTGENAMIAVIINILIELLGIFLTFIQTKFMSVEDKDIEILALRSQLSLVQQKFVY